MKSFESLSQGGQILRLRRLAQVALAEYAVPESQLSKLHHVENTTFRVLAADQQQYLLRIQRPESHTADAIHSEMTWLLALRQDTDVALSL